MVISNQNGSSPRTWGFRSAPWFGKDKLFHLFDIVVISKKYKKAVIKNLDCKGSLMNFCLWFPRILSPLTPVSGCLGTDKWDFCFPFEAISPPLRRSFKTCGKAAIFKVVLKQCDSINLYLQCFMAIHWVNSWKWRTHSRIPNEREPLLHRILYCVSFFLYQHICCFYYHHIPRGRRQSNVKLLTGKKWSQLIDYLIDCWFIDFYGLSRLAS